MRTIAIFLLVLASSLTVFASELRFFESTPKMVDLAESLLPNDVKRISDVSFLVSSDKVRFLLATIHEQTGHCGGFMDVTDQDLDLRRKVQRESKSPIIFHPPAPSKARGLVGGRSRFTMQAIDTVNPQNIRTVAERYSQFHSRYAASELGVAAAQWLYEYWKKMTETRRDITVDLVNHARGYQQSVRVRIPGIDPSKPKVILGAHLDSINVNDEYEGRSPGTDDNASGIATLTETLRVLLAQNFRPIATVEIFGYAAEELGLIGSQRIAEDYFKRGEAVRGVLQLDMVAYPGPTKAVTFYRDYTNSDLTNWTMQLYRVYVGGQFKKASVAILVVIMRHGILIVIRQFFRLRRFFQTTILKFTPKTTSGMLL
ncbi:MAG: M20/M25/M40 family metallo-hydrolase [Bacteriovoracia bacterium]